MGTSVEPGRGGWERPRGVASPAALPHGRSRGHRQGRWAGRAGTGSLCRAQSPGRCGLCVWGCPDPALHTPPPSQSLWSSVCERVPDRDRHGPARPGVTARSAQARNPEPPAGSTANTALEESAVPASQMRRLRLGVRTGFPGPQAARNWTLVRLGASCSPHPLRRCGRLRAISRGRSETPCFFVVTSRGDGSDARAKLCRALRRAVPRVLRLVKTPSWGFSGRRQSAPSFTPQSTLERPPSRCRGHTGPG